MEPYLSPFGEALKATIALLLPLRLRRGSRIENDGEAGIWFNHSTAANRNAATRMTVET